MLFVETPTFTSQVLQLMLPDTYRALQLALLFRPDQGDIIRESGGIRKLRWQSKSRGKRGGLRLLYYWDKPNDVIYMLFLFPKAKQVDLSKHQLAVLRRLVKEELQ
jgi:hypothetical protein